MMRRASPSELDNIGRLHDHPAFKQVARRGKASMGRFYGLKFHLVINEREASSAELGERIEQNSCYLDSFGYRSPG